ncbi:exosortase U, partial [Candidatus Laterigemmans baculatus]|uniref:exosortase U n=1 Tax=Candidatus Laterigemmans baculatus TaxID=2770505 RepID=UPI00193FD1A4
VAGGRGGEGDGGRGPVAGGREEEVRGEWRAARSEEGELPVRAINYLRPAASGLPPAETPSPQPSPASGRGGQTPAASGLPPAEEFFTEELAGWRRVGFNVQQRAKDDPFGGMVSLRWQYMKGSRTAVLSLDGPYREWHNLAICYSAIGWDLVGASDVQVGAGPVGEPIVGRELRLDRPPLDRAQVLFACFDAQGRCVPPSAHSRGLWANFTGRLKAATQDEPQVEGEVMQVQVLEENLGERSEEAEEEIRELFEAAARAVGGNHE